MNMQEARRLAWRAAYLILSTDDLPVSPCEPGDTPESETSVANYARWDRAWNEVLEAMRRRGSDRTDNQDAHR